MITYQTHNYKDYIELFLAMLNEEVPLNESIFTHSRYFYIRALLKDKFPEKNFTIEEIEELLDEEIKLGYVSC